MTDILPRLTAALAGRYALERELGRGGMATVYCARDLRHDRMVALKVVRPVLSVGAGPGLRPLLATGYSEGYPSLSPDGKWLAYVTDESGRSEVYIRPFPGPGGRVQVSLAGGSEPIWNRNGRELFYRRSDPEGAYLVAASVRLFPSVQVLSRTPLFQVSSMRPRSRMLTTMPTLQVSAL